MSRRYEILLMDADGTLLDFDRAEREAFLQLLVRYGLPPEEALVEEYHQINKECWEALENGEISREEVLTGRFKRFFSLHDCPVDVREAEEFYRVRLGQGFFLLDGAIEILTYLKERYELYIVTNGVAQTQHLRLRESGLEPFFRDIFISEEVGSQKPQKEFFDACFQKIPHGDPEKMLIIGDSLTSDIRGGINAGIDTCWYNPRREVNSKGIRPLYEIEDLAQLRTLL